MPDLPQQRIVGAQRAAVFLLSLGEEAAARVLRHMEPSEVQEVGKAMTELSTVSNADLESVVGTFTDAILSGNAVGADPVGYVRKTLSHALGETKGRRMVNRILQGEDSKGMEALKWMDAESVALILRHEHPQICAVVLSFLASDHAAQVLSLLPPTKLPDIVTRIAKLESVHPAAIEELDEIIQKKVIEAVPRPLSKVHGVKRAADILTFVDSSVEADVLEQIENENEELGSTIRDLLFVFENLLTITDRHMQRLLQDVQKDRLTIAMKAISDEMKNKITSNMSSRASEMLLEDLELQGPVRLKDVEDAQKEILQIAINLAADGEIALGGKGGDEYV